MFRVGVYDQIKSAFQDIIAPELHVLRGEMRAMNEKVERGVAMLNTKLDALQTAMVSMKNELLSEIRRLDVRIDSVDRELRLALDIRERLAALEARRQP